MVVCCHHGESWAKYNLAEPIPLQVGIISPIGARLFTVVWPLWGPCGAEEDNGIREGHWSDVLGKRSTPKRTYVSCSPSDILFRLGKVDMLLLKQDGHVTELVEEINYPREESTVCQPNAIASLDLPTLI